MARAMMWCALALGALASGARYGDYGDAKMPEYGSAIDYDGPRDSPPAPAPDLDDYHDHTPDAPSPMEYKYEEDRGKSNKRIKEVAESDEWQNSVKKHKNYIENENQENFDAYSSEDSNYKSNLRPLKHRPRLKTKYPHEEEPIAHNKHVVRYGGNRKKDMSDMEGKESMDGSVDDFEDEKGIDFEDDQTKIQKNHRVTTVRTARRKPRDRYIKPEPTPDEEDPIMNIRRQPVKEDFRPDASTQPRHLIRRPQYRPTVGPKAQVGEGQRGSYLPKKYDDYAEYYDMKRVQDVKEKLLKDKVDGYLLPTMRKFPLRSRPRPPARLQDDDDDDVSYDNGLEGLRRLMNIRSTIPYLPVYGNQREQDDDAPPPRLKMIPLANENQREQDDDEPPPRLKIIPQANENDTQNADIIESPVVDPALRMEISRTPRPGTPMTVTRTITTTTDTTTSTTTQITTKPTTTTTTTLKPTTDTVEVEVEEEEETEKIKTTTTELSLAEKSRLSILKKAQRKEMLKESATKKPPVLLQVTNRRHTLVMVEPATRVRPWQTVTEIANDNPENIMKVKRLMRKKLVENAKSLHELSENWDDMICDYVDMSLLETQAASSTISLNTMLMFLSLIAMILF